MGYVDKSGDAHLRTSHLRTSHLCTSLLFTVAYITLAYEVCQLHELRFNNKISEEVTIENKN